LRGGMRTEPWMALMLLMAQFAVLVAVVTTYS
jgi:hypothetical protein